MAQEAMISSRLALPKQKQSPNLGIHKTASSVANLANLLPTGTVLAFQALAPSFSNNGECETPNKYLTTCLVALCSLFCFLSSFTDSFKAKDGKVYYGIATFHGFYVFNSGDWEGENVLQDMDLEKLRISFIDMVHAFVSLLVFLLFAIGSSDVQGCYFHQQGSHLEKALITNLPLGVGFLSSFLFTIFPTKRRGIGYTEMAASRTHQME
ncbi:protein DMP10-like [Punica granatum]|uniref:Uncharacterized protein n=2 Tax=Punica granatum TaxID=22663 RepID=A0A218VR38_PUNGR|nr:protein DMP10-like [Punica granatum]OWM62965.1 hypothetical protein CDL15_Pgr020259 [Punica granatum]PKI78238.1 hypothetical protein CRG98_001409 [Punica granatum]